MTWTVPDAIRIDEPFVADERPMLEGWLDCHRTTLWFKCSGLTAEQLAERPVPPANLSLLGLNLHLKQSRLGHHGNIGSRQSPGQSAVRDRPPARRPGQPERHRHSRRQQGRVVQEIECYEVRVPATTLTSILDRHRVKRIDFLSLDVEGFELQVLQGIDFERHRPSLMLIEARWRDEIDSFLKPLYSPIAQLSHHDVLYKRIG